MPEIKFHVIQNLELLESVDLLRQAWFQYWHYLVLVSVNPYMIQHRQSQCLHELYCSHLLLAHIGCCM